MLQAIILGIVQGLTEFLPISSSAHLAIVPEILGWQEQSTVFDLTVHGGTLLAVLIIYRKKIFEIATQSRKTAMNIVIATIPSLIVGALLLDYLDSLKSNYLIVFMLISIGVLMIIADYWNRIASPSIKTIEEIPFSKSLITGLAQPIAFLRGGSRSGVTILAGKFSGLDNKTAIDFSFILGIPTIAIGFLYGIYELIKDQTADISVGEISIGFFTSFISGLIAITLMLKLTEKIGFKWFGIYRIILAIFILIFIA